MTGTSRPSGAALQNQLVFRITSIDVEYYESYPTTQVINFSKANDKILFKDHSTNEWVEKTETFTVTQSLASSSGKEFIKIGDVIFEIDKDSAPKFIVQINPTNGLGLFIGTKFRIYPDPEKYKMDDGSGAKAYRVTIKSHRQNQSNSYSYAYYSGSNLKNCHNSATTKFNGFLTNPESGQASATTPKTITSALSEQGMSKKEENWIMLAQPTAATLIYDPTSASTLTNNNYTNGYNGSNPIVWIDAVELEISSDTPNPPAVPTIDVNLAQDKFMDGKWHSISPITITLAPQTDDYDAENHTIRYVESKTQLDVETIDWSADNVKLYNAPIQSSESMYYYARVESTHKDETIPSEVVQTATRIVATTVISDLAELHKEANNGKVVQLDMPLMVRAHTLVYPQDATNKYTNAVYARDVNGASVKLISRRNKKEDPYFPYSNSTFSPLTYAFNGVNPTLSLMKPGMVIGMYHYNGGKNPEIVVRDLTSDPAVDVQPSAIAY